MNPPNTNLANTGEKKRCKHQTGRFLEVIEAEHARNVIDGVLDKDSYNNEYGGLICHYYQCERCGKEWRWTYKPRQKWLNELFINAYKET